MSINPATPNAGVIVGWMGRPPSYKFLLELLDALPEAPFPSTDGTDVSTDKSLVVDALFVAVEAAVVCGFESVVAVAVVSVFVVVAEDVLVAAMSVAVWEGSGSARRSNVSKALMSLRAKTAGAARICAHWRQRMNASTEYQRIAA